MYRVMTWKQMDAIARMVDARISVRDGDHYLKYDSHGEVFVSDTLDAMETLEAYKGGHPNFADAKTEATL